MSETVSKKSFVKQAGILAMAGIACRIIGILYRSPLTGIIGDEGNGYYTTAYNLYTIILLISSYSIPSAVSKVIAARLAVNEFKNAARIFRCAVMYVVVVGGVAALFTWCFAGVLTGESSARVLRIFAPTIFLSGLLGVLRGFFQAHGTMVPTSISQIIEQIANAAMSIIMALVFISMFERGNAYFGSKAVAGACGSAVGTGAGVAVAFVFMLSFYMKNRVVMRQAAAADNGHRQITFKKAYVIIAAMVTPIVLSTFIYNFSTSLNQEIFGFIQSRLRGMDEAAIATQYGIFAGKAVVITNIPIALAAAMSSAIIPVISGAMASGKKEEMNAHIGEAVHATMIIAIPAAVGMMVLSQPVVAFLFPQRESLETASLLLKSISFSVVFYGLSTVTNGSLQAAGKVMYPVKNAAISLIVQTIIVILLLYNTRLDIYSLAVAMLVYSGLMCILNQRSLSCTTGYRQEIKKTLLKPLLASAIMGAAAWIVQRVLVGLIGGGRLSLVITIFISVAVYMIAVIITGALEEEDLLRFPGGRTITSGLKRARLLR